MWSPHELLRVGACILLGVTAACGQNVAASKQKPGAGDAGGAGWVRIGSLDSPRLSESSGLVKSRKYADIFWTHNDSGNAPVLFAVRLTGEVVAEIPLAGAHNLDWEDIAIDHTGRLFIGDIGDNARKRTSYQIYELPEPNPFVKPIQPVRFTKVHRYRFPEGCHNCEALFVFDGKLHIITKKGLDQAIVYRLDPQGGDRLSPVRVGIAPPAPVTAADVSPDGKRLAVLTYGYLAVYPIGDDLSKIGETDAAFVTFPMNLQTEACCFDGNDVIITAESRQIWRVAAEDVASEKPLRDEN